jgi:hypothetical protein
VRDVAKPTIKVAYCNKPECRAEIVFLKARNGGRIPVNADTLSPDEHDLLRRGLEVRYRSRWHVSHHRTCAHETLSRLQRSLFEE